MDPLGRDDPGQAGNYRLSARLGEGGMGRVFLGFSPAGRAVAVKLIHPELARDLAFRARFRREVAAAGRVSGAYTAPVLDAGPDDDPPWLATAYVPGPTLSEAVAAAGPLPPESVRRLAAGLAEALVGVHRCEVVHRDLKPSNVLLAADGPRVIDFGVCAAAEGTAVTLTAMVLGTPAFMSPEQAEGGRAGPPSDVFSLGGVIVFAATGLPPFGDGSPAAVLYRVVHNAPGLDGLDGRLREVAASCLAKDPADRPSPEQVIEALAGRPEGSPASFWPDALGGLIRSHEALLLSARPAPSSGAPDSHPPTRPADGRASPGFNGGARTVTSPQVAPPGPARSGPARSGPGAPAGTPVPGGDPAPPRPPGGARRPIRSAPAQASTVDRRSILTALTVGSGALAVGGWELSRILGQRFPQPKVVWQFTAGSDNGTAIGAVLAAGVLCTYGSFVWGLRPDNGTVIWKRDDMGLVRGQPSVVRDIVYILASNDLGYTGLYALRASTGRHLWTTGFDDVPGSVTVAGGVAYVGGGLGSLHALRTGDGRSIWSIPLNGAVAQAGGVTSGVVCATAGSADQIVVYGVRAADGKVLWKRSSPTSPGATSAGPGPLASRGVVYVGNGNGAVLALRASDGHTLWSYPAGASSQALTMADGIVYCGGSSLYALRASRGTLHWSRSVTGTPTTATLSDSVVYLGTNDASSNGGFYAIRARDGSVAWHYAPGAATGPIAVAHGTAYAGSDDGNLYALRTKARTP